VAKVGTSKPDHTISLKRLQCVVENNHFPDASKIAVFSKGDCTGLNGWIPVSGQVDTSSVVGDNLVWKNAQKNNIKNKISETINRIILHRRPFVTIFVFKP
jgi:hypothetical protein